MGCLQLQYYTPLQIAHTSKPERSGEGKSCAGVYKYKYNGKELQEELGLNMTAMDWRQYDNAIGRFVGMDLLSESMSSVTPYHFGFNNPVFWADPSGLLSQSAINSMWNASPKNRRTTWTNTGDGFESDYKDKAGNVDFVDYNGGLSETMPMLLVTITTNKYGYHFDQKGMYGTYTFGEQVRDHVYKHSKYYQARRDRIASRQLDETEEYFSNLGNIPIIGEPFDFLSGTISLARGNYKKAGISFFAMAPVAGNFAPVLKIQKHHIIPQAVYRDADDVIKNAMNLHGGSNLKKLPTPFHGNHPQYNIFVKSQLDAMQNVTPGSIQTLQKNLNGMINQAYDNYKVTGQNLNDYFRNINGN